MTQAIGHPVFISSSRAQILGVSHNRTPYVRFNFFAHQLCDVDIKHRVP